jgi:hypothetical protein
VELTTKISLGFGAKERGVVGKLVEGSGGEW